MEFTMPCLKQKLETFTPLPPSPLFQAEKKHPVRMTVDFFHGFEIFCLRTLTSGSIHLILPAERHALQPSSSTNRCVSPSNASLEPSSKGVRALESGGSLFISAKVCCAIFSSIPP